MRKCWVDENGENCIVIKYHLTIQKQGYLTRLYKLITGELYMFANWDTLPYK